MKYSNFKIINVSGGITFATVSFNSFFNLLPSKIKIVFKNNYNSNWRFLDTGQFTPASYIEDLEQLDHAQEVYNSLSK